MTGANTMIGEDLWNAIWPLLPSEPPKPRGARPRVPDRAALAGIVYVSQDRNPVGYAAQGDGLWQRGNGLATSQTCAGGLPGRVDRAGHRVGQIFGNAA
jgi:transposase